MKSWLDTADAHEAAGRRIPFWDGLRERVRSGEGFWADRVQGMKASGDLAGRLQLSMANLPLPAAFREAVLVLRAVIKLKRASGADPGSLEPLDELQLLYWLAAIDSLSIPFSTRLRSPGFNVMESFSGAQIRALPVEYPKLGYLKLPLLIKTDRRWLVEAWGEPEQHTTMHALHLDLWESQERRLLAGESSGLGSQASPAVLTCERRSP